MTLCAIPDCTSGARKTAKNPNPEVLQTFPFPSDPRARNRWLRECSLKKDICKGARICAKHFQKNCFLSSSQNVDGRGKYLSLFP